MWGEVRRCGGLPALARVRAARGVRVVGEEGAQKGVDDGRVGAVAGELVRARVADNLGQVEIRVREGEDGEVAFTAKLEGLLAKAGNPRKFADLVLRLADKKFPKLFRDKRPPPPKKEKKPRPPKAEAKKKAEAKAEPAAEAKADAAPEVFESGEEDVVDLDEDEDEVMDLDAEL